ncbi:MAG: MarR family transcriptional regulator [Bacteroidetes bacterium]|nr:MarR family transcriptional regulator [Bacteroidota bacterium]
MDFNEIVLKTLQASKEPLKSGDVAEKAGIDKKDADKAIKSLMTAGKVESPKRCFYSPKN